VKADFIISKIEQLGALTLFFGLPCTAAVILVRYGVASLEAVIAGMCVGAAVSLFTEILLMRRLSRAEAAADNSAGDGEGDVK